MRRLRAIVRLKLVALATGGVVAVWAIGAAVLFWSNSGRLRLRHWVFRSWARSLLRITNARVVVSGTPPRPPFFLVANHLSYFDIALIASQVTAMFVAKKEIRSWPVIGFLSHCMGTIFIDRGSRRDIPRVLRRIDTVMASGEGVVIFPEGTSGNGEMVLPFRPPLLEAASRTSVPVSCAAVRYSTPAGEPHASRSVCWWGGMAFFGHLMQFLALETFTAEIVFGETRVQEEDRKKLADRLWSEVDRLFVPMTEKERACA